MGQASLRLGAGRGRGRGRPRVRGGRALARGPADAGGARHREHARRGGRRDPAGALRRVRSRGLPRRCPRGCRRAHAGDGDHRGALSPAHQDQDRHLARPRRAPAQDRGRGAARRHSDEGQDARRGHAADGAAHRDDRRSRARPTRHELEQCRRAGSGKPEERMNAAWDYRDPLEPALSAQVSDKTLMEHVRTIGALERESGSPGEAQAFDYIERMLKSYGVEVERREIEAYISLPLEGRVHLPDGGAIEGLTHSFSTSVEALEGELVDVGDGRPADFARADAAGKIALINGLPAPGRAWAAQQAGTLGHIFVLMDHLHNMIVTTIWGTPSPDNAWRVPPPPCPPRIRPPRPPAPAPVGARTRPGGAA